MLRDTTGQTDTESQALTSADIVDAIGSVDFASCAATVLGYGNMGKEHIKALRALGVGRIRVCSRSSGPLEELRNAGNVETVAGGFERLEWEPQAGELAIVSTPTADLVTAAKHLATLGFQNLLIEKPVSLGSKDIGKLAGHLDQQGANAVVGFNRVAYPSYQEARARTSADGGIVSCTYAITEWVQPDWTEHFTKDELARWGIANSLHVVGMAHGLIGGAEQWSSHRSGSATSWHPTGSVFVGSGISDRGVPFCYHADWSSTDRWGVEVHTAGSSYRLRPLEQLFMKGGRREEWEQVPVATFDPDLKVGFGEQIAAMLSPTVRRLVPLVSLTEAEALTRFGENIFGYDDA